MPEIESKEIEDLNFFNRIDEFYKFISKTESKYAINLSSLNGLKKYLYSLTLPSERNSRMLNHKQYVHHLLMNKSRDLIEEQLFSQNKNPEEEIEHARNLIESIFESFSNSKGKYLYEIDNFDIILVPDFHIPTWEEEFKLNGNAKIQTISSFLKDHKRYTKTKNVILLSIFGYGIPSKVIKSISSTPHNFLFLTYPEEESDFNGLTTKYKNGLINEYSSVDRLNLTGIKFETKSKPVEISELIEEVSSKALMKNRYYDYDTAEVNYKIEFNESSEVEIHEGSKSVLLENGPTKRKEKISNLRPNDKVRIYSNPSKEKLFEIAQIEDQKGKFSKIEQNSILWKTCLRKYYKKKIQKNRLFNEESLLNELQAEGANIKTTHTLKKWLSIGNKDKFPNAQSSLLAIKNVIKNQQFNLSFKSVMQSKRLYRSIMIALGRDLSDEVMDYVISKGKVKGNLLKKFTKGEIKSFLKKAASLRTISKIKISE